MLTWTTVKNERLRMYKIKILWIFGMYIIFSLWEGGHLTLGATLHKLHLSTTIGVFSSEPSIESQG